MIKLIVVWPDGTKISSDDGEFHNKLNENIASRGLPQIGYEQQPDFPIGVAYYKIFQHRRDFAKG